MSYTVIFSPTAIRDLDQLSPRIVPAIVEFAYGDLTSAPRQFGRPLSRQLTGEFSACRGPYRLIYAVDDGDQTIGILRVAHLVVGRSV